MLLCAPDGGAAPGACDGVDPSGSACGASPDAGCALHGLPDGGIGGAWPEPGSANGPPEESWHPVTGSRTCPESWRLSADGTCDPMVPVTCPVGTDPLPGGRCTRTADCGESVWPGAVAPSADGHVMHLREGEANAMADGSAEHPFGTLEAAVGAAGMGGVVLVTDGTYPVSQTITQSVSIVGRCASRVRFEGRDAAVLAAFDVRGVSTEMTLRGVTLRSPARGVYVSMGATLSVRDVRFEGTRGDAIQVNDPGASATVIDVSISGARDPAGERVSFGVGVLNGGAAEVTDLSMNVALPASNDATTGAVRAVGAGTRAVLRSVLLRGVAGGPASRLSYGVFAGEGASVEASEIVSESFPGIVMNGAMIHVPGATLRARDVVCRGTGDRASRAYGECFGGSGGAEVSIDRFAVSGVFNPGPVYNDGGAMSLANGTIQDVLVGGDARSGLTVASTAGSLRVSNVILRRLPKSAFLLGGGRIDLADVEVREVESDGALMVGRDGATAEVSARRLRLDGVHGTAAAVTTGSSLTLSESVVRGVEVTPGAPQVAALGAVDAATLSLDRVLVAGVVGVGVFVGDKGSRLSMSRSFVRDVSRASEAALPIGVFCVRGAETSVQWSVVSDVRTGVVANSGCHLSLTHTRVAHTLDPAQAAGAGVVVTYGATAEVQCSLIEDAGLYALFAGGSSRIEATDLIVRDIVGGHLRPDGTTSSEPFLGVGVALVARASATLRRVAAERVGTAAIVASEAIVDGDVGPVGHAIVDADELFVRDVAPRSMLYSTSGTSPPLSLGLYAGPDSRVSARRATLERMLIGAQVFTTDVNLSDGVFDGGRCLVEGAAEVMIPASQIAQVRVTPPATNRCVDTLGSGPLATPML